MANCLTIIGQSAFKNKAIKKINMPNTITKIEYGAFANCKKLSSIALPNSIVEMEQSAFENCTSIEQITLPPKLTSIEGRLFMNCTSLKSIVIPDHVVDIGGNAFAGCTSLTSIQLPESLELIESIAFKGTTSLETIIAPAYKKSIVFDDDVWEDSKITTSFLYKNGYRYFLSDQMCSDYALIEEHLKNIDILSTDNDLEKIRKVHD